MCPKGLYSLNNIRHGYGTLYPHTLNLAVLRQNNLIFCLLSKACVWTSSCDMSGVVHILSCVLCDMAVASVKFAEYRVLSCCFCSLNFPLCSRWHHIKSCQSLRCCPLCLPAAAGKTADSLCSFKQICQR